MILKFVKFNLKISKLLDRKFKKFFIGSNHPQSDLLNLILNKIPNSGKDFSILEIGGIDRPMLKKSPNFKYTGLDIEYKDSCYKLYDNFIVQSIEENINQKFDLIISSTLLEHVKDNKKSFLNVYNALVDGGNTFHYIPSKNHFYSLILRLVGPKLQRKIIKNLRPQASLEITGYPTFFDLCSEKELKNVLLKIGFRDVKIRQYYKAGDYFAFFTPLYILISALENIFEKFNIRFFAAGLIVSAKK